MTGKRIGYIRVSSADQNPDRQLADIPLDKKFIEYASGKDCKRPELNALLEYIREDDELFIHSIDRLARNVRDLHELIDMFVKNRVTVNFVKQNLRFDGNNSPISKFQLTMLGAVAEFERELILERHREGVAEAKKQGKYRSKPKKLNAEKIEILKQKLLTRDSKTKIAKDLGISRFCLYSYLKEIEKTNENN